MVNYKSSHTGTQIDTAVTAVANDNAKVRYGNIIGTLSNQVDLTNKFAEKVDKETGKGLSTNDFTTAEKTKLANLEELPSQTSQAGKFLTTDGTTTSWDIPTASTAWGNITGTLSSQTDLQTALNNKQDVLTGLTATVTELNYTSGVTSAIQTQLDSKQDIIQYSTMPTASQATAGNIVEYTGTTTSSYTHGYVYEGISLPENVTAVQTAGQLDLGDITTNLSTFKAAMGSSLAVGTYLFKFVGYPTQIVATNSSTSATVNLTREPAQDTGDAYAWVGSDSVIYFTNTNNAQIGTIIYDSNLEATAYTCTSITARSTTVNTSGVWVLGNSDTNINISNYGMYFTGIAVVGTIISATYSLESSYWQQLNVQPVKEVIQNISTLSANAVTLTEGVSIYSKTIFADTTFTFDVSNLGSLTNKAVTFELYLDMSPTVYTLTFPSSVTWIEEPDFTSTGKYLLVFRSMDGGSSWVGNLEYMV